MTSRARQFVRAWVLPFVDPRQLAALALLPRFVGEMRRFRRAAPGVSVRLADAYPCLADRVASTPYDPHYFYQSAWLARRVAAAVPALHVDIGSSVLMLSVLSARTPTVFLDYRPLRAGLPNLHCVAGSGVRLPFADASLESVSSLHVIEHIGLGRYGDPLDPRGSERAAAELGRVVKPGGRLYLSVPVGRERVCFNAHRVFSPHTIAGWLRGLRLEAFALVDDAGRFQDHAPLAAATALDYGCGMFEFVRDRD
jgi:SAM-dependent methyltransferase